VKAAARVRPAVVNIQSERTVQAGLHEDLFAHAPSQNRINGMGTGIVIDPRGYIITNYHVVEDVSTIRASLSDGSTYPARVLARDVESDLALLKVEPTRPLPTMPLGTTSDLMVGETVIAIGNAYGYQYTVTVGVVSAVKRDVSLNKEISYKSLIQTDASINPGNSGGPLVNINGELVGVNVAIRAGAQGISFAIPVETMIRVAADMMSVRKRSGLWHGIVSKDVILNPEVTRTNSTDELPPIMQRQLVVDRIEPASPAVQAGLHTGDVLLRVADVKMDCTLDLERALLGHVAGDRVTVLVRRKGADQSLDLVLQSVERPIQTPLDIVWRRLGVRLQTVEADLVSRANGQLHGGLAIVEVRPDSTAGKAGIQRGDILVGLHQWETISVDNVIFVLTHRDLASFNPLRFFIVRGGTLHQGWMQQVE
jgi:serine protease Do